MEEGGGGWDSQLRQKERERDEEGRGAKQEGSEKVVDGRPERGNCILKIVLFLFSILEVERERKEIVESEGLRAGRYFSSTSFLSLLLCSRLLFSRVISRRGAT